MAVPVGLNVWSRLVETTFPYLDRKAGPLVAMWLPDHVQYGGNKVAEGWSLLTWALARYPDEHRLKVVLGQSISEDDREFDEAFGFLRSPSDAMMVMIVLHGVDSALNS